jgi:predicted alpha/beta-hydrolase family hydrolase
MKLTDGEARLARVVLAHGAGAPMDSEFMQELAISLGQGGVEVTRFEFSYMQTRRETGKKRPPDSIDELLACYKAVVQEMPKDKPIFLAGKSMGGRVASMLLNELDVTAGFVFGYPFHPVAKPESLRVNHLMELTKPLYIYQGTRDKLGSQPEVNSYMLPENVQVAWFESADHDLKPLKRSGFAQHEYIHQAAANVLDKIAKLVVLKR